MSRLSKAVILGLISGVAGLGAGFLPFGIALEENLDLEILFHLRGARNPPAEILIVGIDKASADFFRLPNDLRKWPRSLHANLTDRLDAGGASVIAFDIFFEEPRSEREDRQFAESMGKARNVVLCERLQSGTVSVTDKGGTPAADLSIAKLIPPTPPFRSPPPPWRPSPCPRFPSR